MNLIDFLSDQRVAAFVLLLARLGGLFAFLPIFSMQAISTSVKGAMTAYFAFIFFPLVNVSQIDVAPEALLVGIAQEVMLGFVVGLVLSILLAAFSFAGEQASMVMGLSMGAAFDPLTQQSSQLISQFLGFVMLMVLFVIDAHHILIYMMYKSLSALPLGSFALTGVHVAYVIEAFRNMLLLGLTIAFPILAMSMLADVMFGMIMKTMPSFNLMIVGAPLKIVLGIMVIAATLSAMVLLMKDNFTQYARALDLLFFSR